MSEEQQQAQFNQGEVFQASDYNTNTQTENLHNIQNVNANQQGIQFNQFEEYSQPIEQNIQGNSNVNEANNVQPDIIQQSNQNVSSNQTKYQVNESDSVTLVRAQVDICAGIKNVQVFFNAEKQYSAILNQTNLAGNNNKFYICQILKSTQDPQKLFVYARFGKIGLQGQKDVKGPFSQQECIKIYEQKLITKQNNGYQILSFNFCPNKKQEESVNEKQQNQLQPQVNEQSEQIPISTIKSQTIQNVLLNKEQNQKKQNTLFQQVNFDISPQNVQKQNQDLPEQENVLDKNIEPDQLQQKEIQNNDLQLLQENQNNNNLFEVPIQQKLNAQIEVNVGNQISESIEANQVIAQDHEIIGTNQGAQAIIPNQNQVNQVISQNKFENGKNQIETNNNNQLNEHQFKQNTEPQQTQTNTIAKIQTNQQQNGIQSQNNNAQIQAIQKNDDEDQFGDFQEGEVVNQQNNQNPIQQKVNDVELQSKQQFKNYQNSQNSIQQHQNIRKQTQKKLFNQYIVRQNNNTQVPTNENTKIEQAQLKPTNQKQINVNVNVHEKQFNLLDQKLKQFVLKLPDYSFIFKEAFIQQ